MIPESVTTWIRENGFGDITGSQPVTGGCINNGALISTTSGRSFFLKTNPSAPKDMFEREVEGLLALGVPGALRIPTPRCYGPDFLLMDDLEPSSRAPDYWEQFGRALARVHGSVGERYGFHHNNYIGSTPQINTWMEDGHAFYAEHRLRYQARLAFDAGRLDARVFGQVERLARRLPQLVPQQPPSLIHGDLWSGNAITDRNGGPALIDPAVYFGWAEAELAMTALFGRFPPMFYVAYQEIRSLVPGFESRFRIYNLYHLLNHLNLFGEKYLGQVKHTLDSLPI